MPQGAYARPTASAPALTGVAFPAATPSFLRQWAWLSAPKSQKTWQDNSSRNAYTTRRRSLENSSHRPLRYPGTRNYMRHHHRARIHRLQQRTDAVRNHWVLFPCYLGPHLRRDCAQQGTESSAIFRRGPKRRQRSPFSLFSTENQSRFGTTGSPEGSSAARSPKRRTRKPLRPQQRSNLLSIRPFSTALSAEQGKTPKTLSASLADRRSDNRSSGADSYSHPDKHASSRKMR